MHQDLTELEDELSSAKRNSVPFFKFSKQLEDEYITYRHERLLNRVPFIGVSGLVIFVVFAVLDLFVLPESAYIITTAIRLFIICPLIAIAMVGAKYHWPTRIFTWYYLCAYVIAGWGVIAIIYTGRVNGIHIPYDGVLLHLVYGYFIMGMAFSMATLGGILITLGYAAIEVYLDTPSVQFAYNLLFMLTLNIMGFMGSYMQDRSRRHLFLNKKRVELAMKKDELEIESKTKLVATASHDLRQPLHAMNILVEALESEESAKQELKLTSKLKESLRQLSQLLNSLLDISRFNARIVEYEPSTLDLPQQIKTLLHDQHIRSQELGITINAKGPEPCLVKTDPTLLGRIFRNLCENVYEHAQATQIDIHWEARGTAIRLTVRDNGRGISPSDQEAIFDEFHQTDHGSQNGMGLGLAIVKQSCDIMQCRYGVDSTEGEGAEFWVELEQAHLTPTTESAAQKAQSLNPNGSILLVDDDPEILQSCQLLIQKWGYEVIACESPEDALDILSQHQPALLISDYNFENSGIHGIELIVSIREKLAYALPAILVTGEIEGDVDAQFADAFIDNSDITEIAFKPLAPAKLRLIMKHLLRSA